MSSKGNVGSKIQNLISKVWKNGNFWWFLMIFGQNELKSSKSIKDDQKLPFLQTVDIRFWIFDPKLPYNDILVVCNGLICFHFLMIFDDFDQNEPKSSKTIKTRHFSYQSRPHRLIPRAICATSLEFNARSKGNVDISQFSVIFWPKWAKIMKIIQKWH